MYFKNLEMKKKLFIQLLFIFSLNIIYSQVLITTNTELGIEPHPSSALHLSDNNKGLLIPRIPLLDETDQITVPTPTDGVLVYNTTKGKFNFWNNNRWNRNFETVDGLDIIQVTNNVTGSSSNTTILNTFPASMPLFALNSNTTGWTNLGTSTTINTTRSTNTNYIIAEGMTQINNTNESGKQYQFAIGIFVDGQLKIVRKYYENGGTFTCTWKKFSISGVFYDLTIGNHLVEVYGINLPRVGSTTGFNSVSYGGPNGTCSNINQDMARIYLTAQVTQ